ncbi:uncharacterized protein A1O5_01996 [Cladophialophora psammophila CBS 110553]|uniref:UBA domain-containing protein n=1 Tax=Cladophialophora psammophila CBS 110553 TaxID=1182543 RepID=W9XD75_9EURO|nr:uncharacterized protein A1O5_01996 [Cladophialophora psammophila CBS 110553]EXJ75300.1 hypothetical protein A1O5_01996 [Cladophialophora psammophila CBS 110553]
MDITYCEGARLLQDSRADIDSILIHRPNGNLTCKHCYLVIADADSFSAVSLDKDWPLVVSCHVQACASLHDRRAAYSCYACLERGKTSLETSAAALKSHVQSCELIKDIHQSRKPYQPQESIREGYVPAPTVPARPKRSSRPAPAMEATPLKQSSRDVETAQSSSSRRPLPSNPFRPGQTAPPVVPNSPVTPKQTHSPGTLPPESSPALPSRPKTGVSTHAERTYTPPSVLRPEQTHTVSGPRADAAHIFNVPGGFPGHEAASHDPRSPFSQEFPPTPPPPRVIFSHDHTATPIRRKDVKLESNSQPLSEPGREDKSLPTRPTRAPPAPPVLSPPAPVPYPGSSQPISSPISNPRFNGSPIEHSLPGATPQTPRAGTQDTTTARADPAKIQQLTAALEISRARAEYLLSQTGGDLNEAAELGFSEQQDQHYGGMGGGGGWLPTSASQAVQPPEAFPSGAGSAGGRNRRSR